MQKYDLIICLQGDAVFLYLNLCDSYYQLLMHPPECHKTAFSYHYSMYKLNVITLVSVMRPVYLWIQLFDILDDAIIIYLGNILIYSKNMASYHKALHVVF